MLGDWVSHLLNLAIEGDAVQMMQRKGRFVHAILVIEMHVVEGITSIFSNPMHPAYHGWPNMLCYPTPSRYTLSAVYVSYIFVLPGFFYF